MSVRPAQLADIPAVKVLGGYAFEESPTYRNMTPDFDSFEEMVLKDPSYCLFVSEAEDGTLNGFLLGQLQKGLFFKETLATNVVFYVLRKKRGTNVPFRLVREFQKWALMNGVAQIHLSTSGGINLQGSRRFFTRIGFREAGILCVREVVDHELRRRRRSSSAESAGAAAPGGAESADKAAEPVSARAIFDSATAAGALDA